MAAVNDVYRVIFACWYDGQYGLNVRYYWVRAVAGAGLDDGALAEAFYLDFQTLYAPLLTNAALMLGCSVRNLTSLPAKAAAISTGAATPGTAGTAALPTQVTGIITLRSIFAGRANRGRVYIPFPDAASNGTDDRPVAGYVTDAQALGDEMAATLVLGAAGDTITVDPIIKNDTLANRTNIETAVARDAWATQRRRGDYGARNPAVVPV